MIKANNYFDIADGYAYLLEGYSGESKAFPGITAWDSTVVKASKKQSGSLNISVRAVYLRYNVRPDTGL